jgi:GGDEF domain-containing protein
MAENDTDVHGIVGRAMAEVAGNMPMELLLSDSNRSKLRRVAEHPIGGAPGCGVESLSSCAAVRRGTPIVFDDSDALNACPRLRQRPSGPLSATCVPVSFMGRSVGVLHAAGTVRKPPPTQQLAQLTALGIQAGARIGSLRAFERTRLHAYTDGLTGLSNRRALEQDIQDLVTSGTSYALALVDLDHFKGLNDTHGHDAGDSALRLFAEVLRKSIRDADQAARWGGEEFMILFPGASAEQALEVVQYPLRRASVSPILR